MNTHKKIFFSLLFILTMVGCAKHNAQFQGYIEGKYTYLASPIAGELKQLAVNRGDIVSANKLAFVLDQQPEADKLSQAENNLQQAKQKLLDMQKGARQTSIEAIKAQRAQALAKLNLDKKTLLRYQDLFKRGAIDKASVDAASAAYQSDVKKIKEIDANLKEAKLGARENLIEAQQAAVAAATAEVKQAKWAFSQKTVYAPFAGQVFDTYFRVGEFVNAGQPVVSILAPENIKVIFFIPEPMLSQIKIGQNVKISLNGSNKTYSATINFISSKAEYTPPVIYSRSSRAKLVYRIEAKITPMDVKELHVGQPVDVAI